MKKMLLGIVVVTLGCLLAASHGGADERAEPANLDEGERRPGGNKEP